MNIPKVNWQVWAGFLFSVAAFGGYKSIFARWGVLQGFPWANVLLFGIAAALLGVGLRRAWTKPTPIDVVREMLNLAQVGKSDILYDLGSGDGRIVITAARDYGARCVGVDIGPAAIRDAYERARDAHVSERVQFLNEDLYEVDLAEATVVTLYLLPRLNMKLRPKLLAELRPGSRIVSHAWNMGDWTPSRTLDIKGTKIYLWTVPERR
jgi:hypothetical protein